MALASKGGLSQETLLSVLSQGALNNPVFAIKGPAMLTGSFPPAFPLKHQQKDMRLALELGCASCLFVPTAAVLNAALMFSSASSSFRPWSTTAVGFAVLRCRRDTSTHTVCR